MEKVKNVYATQVALFSSKIKDRLEDSLNASLQQIATLGHKYSGIKMWTEEGKWFGILEYEMRIDELVESSSSDNNAEEAILKNYRYNGNHSLKDIGYVGCKALILQNGLDIALSEDYNDMRELICNHTNLDEDMAVNDMVVEVETIDVKIDA